MWAFRSVQSGSHGAASAMKTTVWIETDTEPEHIEWWIHEYAVSTVMCSTRERVGGKREREKVKLGSLEKVIAYFMRNQKFHLKAQQA